jgi:hypothetical protein
MSQISKGLSMFERILKTMRDRIRGRDYVMTLHAEEEMDDDGLTIYDVEHGVLTGNILERQNDRMTSEWKYRIRGRTLAGEKVEIIAKLGATGRLVIITVYLA